MQTEHQGELSLSTIAMPADANANGDIFGGWVMAQMDLAGSIPAKKAVKNRIVTVAVDKMKFLRPVKVGDRVVCYTQISRVGRTSITIQVDVYAERMTEEKEVKVTEGDFTYVSINNNGLPQAIAVTNPDFVSR